MEVKLTENFSLSEFTQSQTAREKGIDNTPSANAVANIKRLANYLQTIRNVYGRPIRITSGFRCKELNKAVGGAVNSQHVSGEAVDINCGSKSDNRRIFDIIRNMRGFDQLIDESNFSWVHVSFRAGRARGEVLKMVNGKYSKI